MKPLEGQSESVYQFRCVVLLSVYGNSPFLKQQLESLRPQLKEEDLLVICEDGKTGTDWDMIFNHLPANFLCFSRLANLGATASFLGLLEETVGWARFSMFCDQDDIWDAKKISTQISRMHSSEWSYHDWNSLLESSTDTPLAGREMIYKKSISRRSNIHFCFETPAPGMTFCLSAVAHEYVIRQLPDCQNLMSRLPHDRVISAFLGARFDAIEIGQPLVTYRQHSQNLIGDSSKNILCAWSKRIWNFRKISRDLLASHELMELVDRSQFNSSQRDHSGRAAWWRVRIRSGALDQVVILISLFILLLIRKIK